jgi:FKBP-type peptidyl-prolyl cis-trans isomerase
MRVGERAAVYVTDPGYGYGDKGSFSFPSVPPSCQLVYEVDMIAWEPPAEVIMVRLFVEKQILQ